jgi:hypothetical protein
MAGKLFSFIHIRQMVVSMYLGDYVNDLVHGKYPATSNYIHTHAKHAIAHNTITTSAASHLK